MCLMGTPSEKAVVELIRTQLNQDCEALKERKAGNINAHISLLAKWLPSINTSSARKRGQAKVLASALWDGCRSVPQASFHASCKYCPDGALPQPAKNRTKSIMKRSRQEQCSNITNLFISRMPSVFLSSCQMSITVRNLSTVVRFIHMRSCVH